VAAFENLMVLFRFSQDHHILRTDEDIVKHKMEKCAFFASSENLGIGNAIILRRAQTPGAKFDQVF